VQAAPDEVVAGPYRRSHLQWRLDVLHQREAASACFLHQPERVQVPVAPPYGEQDYLQVPPRRYPGERFGYQVFLASQEAGPALEAEPPPTVRT
jgi:hypothetical protein